MHFNFSARASHRAAWGEPRTMPTTSWTLQVHRNHHDKSRLRRSLVLPQTWQVLLLSVLAARSGHFLRYVFPCPSSLPDNQLTPSFIQRIQRKKKPKPAPPVVDKPDEQKHDGRKRKRETASPQDGTSEHSEREVPKRRGAYKDENMKRNTALTRVLKSCIRCRMNRGRVRCKPPLPCLPCPFRISIAQVRTSS